ncbi:hypothetical protein [Vibrio variabilis]|uniref:hypothetical protein n=1 Tax=Vibrio variabilis TaxID=990271 RepID=UPI000DD5B595|nr:hypothetical protein [Vibrio variabilis]
MTDRDGIELKISESVWKRNGDGTNTFTWKHFNSDGSLAYERSTTTKPTELTLGQESYQLGSKFIKVYELEVKDADDKELIGDTISAYEHYSFAGRLPEFKLGDGSVVKDCIVDFDEIVRCKDIGVVAGQYRGELYSIESASDAAASSSMRTQFSSIIKKHVSRM